MAKDLNYYRSLRYTRRCQLFMEAEKPYWLAWIEELPGCKVEGSSKVEAYKNLGELFDDYVTSKLEWGSEIPEPKQPEKRTTFPAEKVIPAPQVAYLRFIEPPAPLDAGIDRGKSEEVVTAGA